MFFVDQCDFAFFFLVDISQEPFFRSLLIAAFRDGLRSLTQRSNVAIPKSYGRAMFGIIDESRTLQYGEVFIQHTSNNQLESEIVLGYVALTKNPCLYPGTKSIEFFEWKAKFR